MSIVSSLSRVSVNIKHCLLKSYVLTSLSRHGELVAIKSIHSLILPNDICKIVIPLGLSSNLEFRRFAYRRKRREEPGNDPPVDYLPFPWTRRPKTDEIASSGDRVRTIDIDPLLPRFGLELVETVKGLDDVVRKQFTLENGSLKDKSEVFKAMLVKKVQQHPVDFNSREVQIAILTARIVSLFRHFQLKRKEKVGKVILLHFIHKRNKMLKELRLLDMPRFEWLIKELNIEFTPARIGIEPPLPYTRVNDLHRLTKEYCDKLISEKRAAYHAELKDQQKLFLKEKEEILAWIADEEKDLGIVESDNVSVS